MQNQNAKQPDAKVAQKTQKVAREIFSILAVSCAPVASLAHSVVGFFLRLLRNFCVFCVRCFSYAFAFVEINWVLTPIKSRSAL